MTFNVIDNSMTCKNQVNLKIELFSQTDELKYWWRMPRLFNFAIHSRVKQYILPVVLFKLCFPSCHMEEIHMSKLFSTKGKFTDNDVIQNMRTHNVYINVFVGKNILSTKFADAIDELIFLISFHFTTMKSNIYILSPSSSWSILYQLVLSF